VIWDIAWVELLHEIKEVVFLKINLDNKIINEHERTMKLLMMNLAVLYPYHSHDPSVQIKKKKVTFTNSTKISIRTKITKADTLVEALQTTKKAVVDSKNGVICFRMNKLPIISGWKLITKRFEDSRLKPLMLTRFPVPKNDRFNSKRSLNPRNRW